VSRWPANNREHVPARGSPSGKLVQQRDAAARWSRGWARAIVVANGRSGPAAGKIGSFAGRGEALCAAGANMYIAPHERDDLGEGLRIVSPIP